MSNERYETYFAKMQIDDLTEDMQVIAEKVGIENTLKIVEVLGGSEVHFPLLKSVIRKARERTICKEYYEQNYSFKELTKRHNLSGPWIRQIIRDNPPKTKTGATVCDMSDKARSCG